MLYENNLWTNLILNIKIFIKVKNILFLKSYMHFEASFYFT